MTTLLSINIFLLSHPGNVMCRNLIQHLYISLIMTILKNHPFLKLQQRCVTVVKHFHDVLGKIFSNGEKFDVRFSTAFAAIFSGFDWALHTINAATWWDHHLGGIGRLSREHRHTTSVAENPMEMLSCTTSFCFIDMNTVTNNDNARLETTDQSKPINQKRILRSSLLPSWSCWY